MASSTTTPQPHQEPAESRHGAGMHTPSQQNKDYRRRTTMKLPARFNVEDTEEDAAVPSLDQHANLPMQSLYGLIAQASGRAFFAESHTQTAEGSEDEGEDVAPKRPPQKTPESRSRTDLLKPVRETEDSSGRDDDPMTQSQFLPPRTAISDRSDRMASTAVLGPKSPFITRKLQARSDLDVSSASSSTRTSQDLSRPRTGDDRADLPTTLKNMFLFDEPEDLISEFKCYYIQNVLLHGHLFITEKHVCFYAYLPKKGSKPIKTGHLAKQGKRDPRYSRHWFILKGDVLSYYASAADPHFPIGAVDLRYAISAEIVPEKGKDKRESTTFIITTERRIYYIKADSATSANEWVKQLQRVIFRSHNDGTAVKISIPIANIVEVGQTPVMDFTDTIRLRAGDGDENGSMEEYFFTFLEQGEEATKILQGFVAENKITAGIRGAVVEAAGDSRRQTRSRSPFRKSRSPKPVHSRRLSPQAKQSVSDGGDARRTSQSPSANASSESYVTSSDLTASSLENSQNEDMSASQFLTSNVAFRPSTGRQSTVHRGRPSQDRVELEERSQNSSRSTSPASHVRIQPPTRTESEQTLQGEQNVSQDGSSQSKPVRILPAPFQHAFDLAGRVRDQSKRMGSYLSSSPKDYYSRFSGALVGNKRHYSEADGLMTEERTINDEDEAGNVEEHRRRFLDHFALPESENLEATFYCWLHRVLPLYGKVYIGSRHLCFRSLIYGTKTKLKLPYTDIENVKKGYSYRWGFPGMTIVIRGHEELFFDFRSRGDRDDCVVTSLKILEGDGRMTESVLMNDEQRAEFDSAATEHALLQRARQDSEFNRSTTFPEIGHNEPDAPPILFDDSSASLLDFKPAKSLRVVCLTIGSRGDVQPYIALCKGLLAEGHRPCIATHQEFEGFVTRHGIEFAPVEGNPADLMRICVEYGMFTPSFLIEANNKFRGFLEGLLNTAYTACKDADVLIESPSAMAGIHIAEAMGIPYFRAFTMPWTRTRAYPHAFAPNNHQFGGSLNYFTYVIFDHMFWTATASQINRWRGKVLGLPPTSLEKMQPNKVPFLYNFSPSVVVPPLDFSDWVRVTGYWFLDEGDNWTPPADLLAFIKKARVDEQKLVYIGFGSIVVQDARALTRQIVAAVKQGDVRCILSKGWSDRLNAKDSGHPEIELPDTIFQINAAPHDWLFKQVDAVVHHGGAGTTGASLRAGIPTLVKPFFGDQFFYASRVEDLGVGVYLKKLTAIELGKTLYIATRDERMKAKAKDLGERIRAEHGVDTAIKAIYRDLEYAKTLIKKRRSGKTATRAELRSSSEVGMEEDEEEEEESWTFVEPDSGEETRSRQSSQTRQQRHQQRSNLGLKLLRQGRYGLGY